MMESENHINTGVFTTRKIPTENKKSKVIKMKHCMENGEIIL